MNAELNRLIEYWDEHRGGWRVARLVREDGAWVELDHAGQSIRVPSADVREVAA